MQTFLSAWAILLASLCGIADATCIPPAAIQPPVSPTTGAYFTEVPNAFPDLFPYLHAFGREVAIIQDVIVADLNCDGRPDVLIHMFGNLDFAQRGTDTNAAVPNRLLALVQQADGTFLDQTLALFGTANVDLGGLSVTTGAVLPNMTGDGYPGFAFQINREDGRSMNGPTGYATNAAQTPFVVSNGDGTYQVQFVGRSDWHSYIALAPVMGSPPDVIVNGASPEAFRVQNGQIQSVAGYPDMLGGSFVFFPPEPGRTYSSTVSTPVYAAGSDGVVTIQLGLVSANAQSQWSTGSYDSPFTNTNLVPFISWQGNQSLNTVMTFKGRTYAYADFESACLLHRSPGLDATVVYRWNNFGLPATYQAGDPVDLRVPNLVNGNTLLGFNVSGGLFRYADLNIIGENTQVSYAEIQCGDFNGDGLDDIVVKSISGGIGSTGNFTNGMPLFYLNNGQGGFMALDQSHLPELPPAWKASGGNCIVAKITASGLNDMLCWNVNNFDTSNPMHPILFKALRLLTPPGLPDPPTAVTATAGNGQATISFSARLGVTDYPITGYTATCMPGTVNMSATASPITVTGLTNGVNVTCSVIARNLVGSSGASTSASVTPLESIVFARTGVQSRKTHGSAGTFDLAIDTTPLISGAVTVEPRVIGGGHTIVFQFNGPVSAPGTASVTPIGTASATSLGSEVLVTLTNVPDNQRATVTLANVNGSVNLPPLSIGFLVGDVNNSRAVNFGDLNSMKAHSGQSTNATNFKFDLGATGSINASDISAVKARLGTTLP